jgi:HSP20 family protein
VFSLSHRKQGNGRNRNLATRQENPFSLIRQEFDTLFDQFFGGWPGLGGDWGVPGWGLDVEDAGQEVVVRAEAPGFEATDFDVQVTGDVLHIQAQTRQEVPEGQKEGQPARQRYGHFERWVTLPAGTDVDKVEARYRNGVLEVRLPKTPEAQGRRIEVKA